VSVAHATDYSTFHRNALARPQASPRWHSAGLRPSSRRWPYARVDVCIGTGLPSGRTSGQRDKVRTYAPAAESVQIQYLCRRRAAYILWGITIVLNTIVWLYNQSIIQSVNEFTCFRLQRSI